MSRENEMPLDMLTNKHELMPYNPDEPGSTQVITAECDGRAVEVIVPVFYDKPRVGEVVSAAIACQTLFLLARYDRQHDEKHGTLGFLVVAVPHRDGRYRAVIAHTTYSLEGDGRLKGLGLYPAPGSGQVARPHAVQALPDGRRPPGLDEIRAFHGAVPFRPFVVEAASGERFPVLRAERMAITSDGGTLPLPARTGGFATVALADIATVREIGPDDIESPWPARPT